jgi:RNA recognition motif-containing protein
VYIPLDYHSRQPKGFAFIEYATHEQAKAARDEMNKFKVKGRELEVVFAQEKRKTPSEMKIRSDSPGRSRDSMTRYGRSPSFDRNRRREDERRNTGR